MTEEFDSIGVILTAQRNGKYRTERVFIDGDKVVRREVVTMDRAQFWAHRCAVDDLELLQTELSRGKVHLREPKQLELKFTDD